jgi:hypothetical protein
MTHRIWVAWDNVRNAVYWHVSGARARLEAQAVADDLDGQLGEDPLESFAASPCSSRSTSAAPGKSPRLPGI